MINEMVGLGVFPLFRTNRESFFSPSGFGSRWLNCENSTSGNELVSLIWANVEAADKIDPPTPKATVRQAIAKIDEQRMSDLRELVACETTEAVA
jgi:hypothetical protein